MSSFAVDINFDVLKEDWNVYKLDDETTLRIKIVLVKISRVTEPGRGIGYNFNTHNHVAAFTPSDKKGTPSTKPYRPKELQESVVDDIDFKTEKEDWNSYQLEDDTRINIKLILTRVAKTDKFDPMGSPIYLTQTQTVIKPKISKKLRKKFVSTKKIGKSKARGTMYTV